jgi:hypothetical protein
MKSIASRDIIDDERATESPFKFGGLTSTALHLISNSITLDYSANRELRGFSSLRDEIPQK